MTHTQCAHLEWAGKPCTSRTHSTTFATTSQCRLIFEIFQYSCQRTEGKIAGSARLLKCLCSAVRLVQLREEARRALRLQSSSDQLKRHLSVQLYRCEPISLKNSEKSFLGLFAKKQMQCE